MASTNRIRIFVLLCTAGLCLAAFNAPAQGKEYKIQIARKEKVGQKSQFEVSGATQQKMTMTGMPMEMPPQVKGFKYELSGLREVLKVDANGQATQISFTIESCRKNAGGANEEVADKGVVAIVTHQAGGNKKVEAKDPSVTLSADAREVLDKAINFSADGDEDKAFGSAKPRRVGESWPVNSKYIADMLHKKMSEANPEAAKMAGQVIKEEDIVGMVTLKGVSRVAGHECLDLAVKMTFKKFSPPLPPGANLDKGVMSIHLVGKFPTDPSVPMLVGTRQTGVEVAMTMTPPGGDQQIKMEMNQADTSKSTVTPVK